MDRYGPPAQRRNIESFSERYGPMVCDREYLMAHSGRTVWKSEFMRLMLDDVRAHEFDVLITGYFDRWQRNTRRTIEIVEDVLHPNGVAWVMADRRLVSGDPRDWAQMKREALDAEEYLDRLSEKVHDGYLSKRNNKHDMGGGLVGVGWKRDEKTRLVIPDPDSQPLALHIWELASRGWTDQAIADETGITIWRVRKVLRSPLFRGELPGGRDRSSGIKTNFPAPVDVTTMSQALEHRRARTRAGNRVRVYRVYPLSGGGPLCCNVCGHPVKGDAKTQRDGSKVRVYRHSEARAARNAQGQRCTGWAVNETSASRLEDQVGQLLEGVALADDAIERIRAAVAAPPITVDQLALRRVDTRLRQLGTEMVDPERTREDAEILEERNLLLHQRTSILSAPTRHDVVDPDEAVRYATSLGTLWRETDDEGRRAITVATFEYLGCITGERRGSHRIVKVRLTRDALRHGLAVALPTSLTVVQGGQDVRWPVEVEGRHEWLHGPVLVSESA